MGTDNIPEMRIDNLEVKILSDKARLQEIYDLRVEAYENSPRAEYINRQFFPNGWKDLLDEADETIHWIIEDNNKIIAANRLSVLFDIERTGENFEKFPLPATRPFGLWSRLVVHPAYRGRKIMTFFDSMTKSFILKNDEITFGLCCATPDRKESLIDLGYSYLGDFSLNWESKKNEVVGAYLLPKNVI